MVHTVYGLHIEMLVLPIALNVERHQYACVAHRPELTVEIGQGLRRGATDIGDQIALAQTRLLGRAVGGNPRDHEPAVTSLSVQPDPRLRVAADRAIGNQIGEDRRQEVGRHIHVAGGAAAVAGRVAYDQRADADQPALAW